MGRARLAAGGLLAGGAVVIAIVVGSLANGVSLNESLNALDQEAFAATQRMRLAATKW